MQDLWIRHEGQTAASGRNLKHSIFRWGADKESGHRRFSTPWRCRETQFNLATGSGTAGAPAESTGIVRVMGIICQESTRNPYRSGHDRAGRPAMPRGTVRCRSRSVKSEGACALSCSLAPGGLPSAGCPSRGPWADRFLVPYWTAAPCQGTFVGRPGSCRAGESPHRRRKGPGAPPGCTLMPRPRSIVLPA